MVRADGLWGDDYVHALASFKIGLGLLSKAIPEQHTTRTFEIPAAGTFLLAERTDEHRAFFEEGREAEYFDSTEELHDKVLFYLRNDAARSTIAARGRERCQRSGYDNDSVLAGVMNQIVRAS
jgi:spore maturation protein CgeB